jgi:single-strand DNA-binding protein
MASVNKVILIGNLTRDPQLKYLPSQTALVEFGIACNRKFKGQGGEQREEVTFIDVSAFGKQAEVLNQYVQKGSPIYIEGRLKYDSWEDKNGGGKRHKLTVVVEEFQFLARREGQEGDEQRQQRREPGNKESLKGPAAEKPYGDEQHFKDDDIPF